MCWAACWRSARRETGADGGGGKQTRRQHRGRRHRAGKSPPDGYTLLLAASTTLTLNPAIRQNRLRPRQELHPAGHGGRHGAGAGGQSRGTRQLAQGSRRPAWPNRTSSPTAPSAPAPRSTSAANAQIRRRHPHGARALQRQRTQPYCAGRAVPVAVDTIVATQPLIQSGKIKPLAVLSSQRLPSLPQVPTVAESGYPGFEMGTVRAAGAGGLPQPVQQKLEKALADVATAPQTGQRMVELKPEPGLRRRRGRAPARRARTAADAGGGGAGGDTGGLNDGGATARRCAPFSPRADTTTPRGVTEVRAAALPARLAEPARPGRPALPARLPHAAPRAWHRAPSR